MVRCYLTFLLLSLFVAFPCIKVFSQDSLSIKTDSACRQKDLPQLIRQWFGMQPASELKLGSLILVPTIGSNPAMGFMVGVGGQYAFRFPEPTSLYSLLNASITYTAKKQLLITMKNNVYTKDNKFFLSGDWRFLV